MVAVSTLGGVNEYVPRHLRLTISDDAQVVSCLACGQSEPLDGNASLAVDELHGFIQEHTACPALAR